MELLLLKDVRRLGHIGDIVDVKIGYARNYLLPQRLATLPTEENIKAIDDDKRRAAAERAQRLKEYANLAQQMAEVTVTIEAAANPEGTLYGSVSAKMIAEALQKMNLPITPEQVVLDTPIRTLDNRNITLEFTEEISAQVKLWVVRAGATEDGQSSAESADDQPDDDGELEDDADT